MARLVFFLHLFFTFVLSGAETFTVVNWNLHNYLLVRNENRNPKSGESRKAIARTLLQLRPDVLAVQEIGGASALEALQKDLAHLSLKYTAIVQGYDTNIQVAMLSRFPFTQRRDHTNLAFVLGRNRFAVSRGFGEVNVQVTPTYQFTLFNVHLKSRLSNREADESEIRFQEAKLLRKIIEDRLNENPEANLLVLGDFNDVKNSPSVRQVLGQKFRLLDVRPEERQGDLPNPNVVWTYHFSQDDSYQRVDYIFLSRGIAREFIPRSCFIPVDNEWFIASDHRPIVARFMAGERKTTLE